LNGSGRTRTTALTVPGAVTENGNLIKPVGNEPVVSPYSTESGGSDSIYIETLSTFADGVLVSISATSSWPKVTVPPVSMGRFRSSTMRRTLAKVVRSK
jgi:hypothetical protein